MLTESANMLTEKINSKEYQMSENLKYELLKVVADLKSIETKASIEHIMFMSMDYSKEVEDIKTLRTSPGYLLYLNSIGNEEYRQFLDLALLMLTHPTDAFTAEHRRGFSHYALDILRNKTNLDSISTDVGVLVEELCDMEIVAPQYKTQEANGSLELFLKYLMDEKTINDVDVLFFFGRISNDTILLNQATKEGANTKITILEIIERYRTEYYQFAKDYYNGK